MLKLHVMFFHLILRSLTVLFMLAGFTQSFSKPQIISPMDGEAVQGVVSVIGTTSISQFDSFQLAYSYVSESDDVTWFLIEQGHEEIIENVIGYWDTTVITDGDYSLKLTVFLQDGRSLESVISNVRVRNYSPIETATANLDELPTQIVGVETATQIISAEPTATEFPPNAVVLSSGDFQFSLFAGIFLAVAVLLFIGIRVLVKRD